MADYLIQTTSNLLRGLVPLVYLVFTILFCFRFSINKAPGSSIKSKKMLNAGIFAHGILIASHFYSRGSFSITTVFDGLLLCSFLFAILTIRFQSSENGNDGYGILLWPVNLILSLVWAVFLNSGTRLPEAMRSPYFTLHAIFLFGAYACFFFSFSSSVIYLFQYYQLKYRKRLSSSRLLPSLDAADRSVKTADSIGLGLMILGIVMGYLWLYLSMGDLSSINVKAGLSILASLMYLSEHILRVGKGWQGWRTSLISITGFALILITLAVGRHGY